MFCVKRKPNITKWLNKNKEGHWKYYPNQGWFDDQNRMVLKVSVCQCDQPCYHGFRYCLYGDGKSEYIYPLYTNMSLFCVIFGHHYTFRQRSYSFWFADNLYCDRCKKYSYDFPFDWYSKYGNGFIPDMQGKLKSISIDILSYIHYPKSFIIHDDLPFDNSLK